jgi:galactonate dehydratase
MAATETAGTDEARLTALDRALPALKQLSRYPRGINLDALAFQLEIPKSTLHRALAALQRAGFVEQDGRGDYRLGVEFLRVAFEFHDARDEHAVMQPVLEALVQRFGESAVYARRDGAEVIYVASSSPTGEAFQVGAKLGGRAPAHATALGKALLAFEPDAERVVAATYRSDAALVRRTSSTLDSRPGLSAALELVRTDGFALERHENDLGVDALAFPVFLDNPRKPTGAVALVAVAARTSADALKARSDEIRAVIEDVLGAVTTAQSTQRTPQLVDDGLATADRDAVPADPGHASRSRTARGLPIRIEAVETVVVDAGRCNYVFVRIHSSDGLVGLGEATLEWDDESVVAAVAHMSDVIVGMDARRIEHIWQTLYRGRFWRGGPVLMSAISGIEMALWDLKGKSLGAPVYELLGGACRDFVPLYANGPRGSTLAEFAASAAGIVARGYRGMKFAAVDATLAVDTGPGVERVEAIVAAVREAVGPEIAIAVDVHGRMSPAMSIRLARAIERHDIWFLEEPALPDNVPGLVLVRNGTSIPIAAGERVFERAGYRDLFEQRAVALVQPDIAHCGGISEGRRIAAMAESYQIGFAPHNPLSPVNTVASAHVAMATPNLVSMEYLVDDVPWRDAFLREPLRIEESRLYLSDAPGLGIELDLEVCRAHPPRRIFPPSFRQKDGAVAEW